MKRLLPLSLLPTLLTNPSHGVYLEYVDKIDGDSTVRHIVVDFRYIEDIDENQRRMSQMIRKKGISFTDVERVYEKQQGFHTTTLKEKDFFTSPASKVFAQWIETADEIRSLTFLGVSGEHELTSVENAFRRIEHQHKIHIEMDDFVVLDDSPPSDDSADYELSTVHAKKETFARSFWEKFKRVSVKCSGKNAEKGHERIRSIIDLHCSKIKENFSFE